MYNKNGELKEYYPSFGQGKDMKAKTRAKWYPVPFVFPRAYTAPTGLPGAEAWQPPGSVVTVPPPAPSPEVTAAASGGVDKPFSL